MSSVRAIFVAGRQHSGNTVMTYMLGMSPECYAANVEGLFFEWRGMVDKQREPVRRAELICELLRLEEEDLAAQVRTLLTAWSEAHPDATSVEVYRQAMLIVTEQTGTRAWARRATSYIFYADDILEQMPEAKIIYLLRNPWDICASRKRRGAIGGHMPAVLGWNRGFAAATRLQADRPDAFRIVRYEDLVQKPEDTARDLFDFVGLRFDPSYLEVPHLNRSEDGGGRESASRGLNPSRVFYYLDVLSAGEIAAVDAMVRRAMVAEQYPDLPHVPGQAGLGDRVRGWGTILAGPVRIAADQARQLLRHNPAWRIRRLAHRARTMAR